MNQTQSLERLMHFLHAHHEDRGIMADLRRGFSPGTEDRAWPHIAPCCDLADDRQRIICQTIAAGFTICGGSSVCGNLGVTLRKLALDGHTGKKEDALASFDARFRRLLACDTAEQVCRRLVPVIKAAERKKIPVDFERLFRDLYAWENPEAQVKIRWAATYWSEPGTLPEEDGE